MFSASDNILFLQTVLLLLPVDSETRLVLVVAMVLPAAVHDVPPIVDYGDEVGEVQSLLQGEGIRHGSAQELDGSPHVLGLMAVTVQVSSPSNII